MKNTKWIISYSKFSEGKGLAGIQFRVDLYFIWTAHSYLQAY